MDETEKIPQSPAPVDLRAVRRRFSVAGWSALAFLLIGSFLQILIYAVFPSLFERDWAFWVFTFAPLYLIGLPTAWLILRKLPRFEGEKGGMTAGFFFRALLVSLFMMYAGNLVGIAVNAFLQTFGTPAGNPLLEIIDLGSAWIRVLIMVVLGPIVEELFFRRLLIDRLRGYGEKLAVLVSALMFGLFHGNLSQFFYAFALGLVFGYVYLRTRQLRWSILLHLFINLLGTVLAPALAGADGGLLIVLYSLVLLAASVAGLVLLIRNARRLRFDPEPEELPRGSRFSAAFVNAGMILFVLVCLGLMVYAALNVG